MGYQKPVTVYRLKFEDRDGLEVKVASVSIGKLMDLQEQAERLKAGSARAFDDAKELFDLFARSLRSWNVEEEDGSPTPCTLAGVMSLEFGFAAEILLAWFEAIASVPAPLARRSTGGLPSVELPSLALPMESMSVSLPS